MPAGDVLVPVIAQDGTTKSLKFYDNGSGELIPYHRIYESQTASKRIVSLASTNQRVVDTGGFLIRSIHGFNEAHTNAYLKIYDKATAPVIATDVPIATYRIDPWEKLELPLAGIELALGLAIAITGGPGDTNAVQVAADQVYLNFEVVEL